MRRILVLTAALTTAATALVAQSTGSPFRPLPLPPPNVVRSAGGGPGPAYWQNRADYNLTAVLDTAAQELRGSGTIRYTNRSADTLAFVWLQMDQNIQAGTSINRLAPPPPLLFAGVPFEMAVTGPDGGFIVDSLATDRGPVMMYRWDTMLRLDLARPLAPGETAAITLGWHFPIPVNGVARMGRDGSLYEIAQWYPRLAVYDDVNGWNTLPYIGPGEFYLEYGDFTVTIVAPASYIVAATGQLTNPADVLTPAQRERIARVANTNDVVSVVTAQEAGNAALTRPTGAGPHRWVFSATNVRDFAFAAAPNFRWDMARIPGQSLRVVQTFYRPGAANWEEAIRMARHAMESFSQKWLEYPYPQATVVEGPVQGMEYPMIVFVPAASRTDLGWVLMHELGHEWYPMVVGSDERRYPWMDEGFNSFIDLYTVADYFRDSAPVYADSVLNGPLTSYADNALRRREQPLITPPAEVVNVYWTAYQKPALMLRLLREEVLGAEAFDGAFREYTRRWAFRHPQPADFFRTMENVTGRDLDWFWRGWIYTTARLDQSVDSVRPSVRRSVGPSSDSVRVVLGNRGEMVMPVEVRLTWSDGAQDIRRIPVEAWHYGPRHAFTVAAQGRRLVRVEVDPRGVYPDTDRRNNTWSGAARR